MARYVGALLVLLVSGRCLADEGWSEEIAGVLTGSPYARSSHPYVSMKSEIVLLDELSCSLTMRATDRVAVVRPREIV